MLVSKPPITSLKKYFIKIAKLYICIVLVNIRNIDVKYSHYGPIHINLKAKKKKCLIQLFPSSFVDQKRKAIKISFRHSDFCLNIAIQGTKLLLIFF